MADEANEPMLRITLTFSLDQGLLEIEGKSEQSGRLYYGNVYTDDAVALFKAITRRLAAGVKGQTAVPLKVNTKLYRVLPQQ